MHADTSKQRPTPYPMNSDGVSIKGCSIIYAPAGQAGEYAPLATNPYRGCGNGCVYCLDPATLIQKADGTSVPLANIQVGDELIGIFTRAEQRRAWNHTYAPSTVLAKMATLKPAYRITLDNGQSAVCSSDHRWLTERGWKHTDRLTLNNHIRILGASTQTPAESEPYRRGYLAGVVRGDGMLKRYDYSGRYQRRGRSAPQATDVQHQFRLAMQDTAALDRATAMLSGYQVSVHRFDFQHNGQIMPAIRNHSVDAFERIADLIRFDTDSEWQRGFLSGIFDAEGSTTSDVIRIYNKDAELLAVIEHSLGHFGFRSTRDVIAANGCTSIRVLGGMAEVVRFFNLTAPAIMRKFPLTDTALRGSSKIVAIEPLGTTLPMLDITTSTENFIANGMVSHNCYVPKVLRMDRKEFDAGAEPRQGFLQLLAKDAAKYQANGVREQVMLSFTTDPYHPGETSLTRAVLLELQDFGLGMCTLTKGGTRALRDRDLFRPGRDAFASTLTSLDDRFSLKWERNAALPGDRLAALRAFHEAGIFTWVSLEPTLDVESSLEIVRQTHGFVDLYKIGRANYLPMTATTDWRDYTVRMIDLCQQLGAAHYVKRDLQPHLPAGYHNPKRRPQHH